MTVLVHLGLFALVSYFFMFTGRFVLALRADPFGFFINSRLRVWGRGVVAWVGALFLRSLLVNLFPVLLVSGLAVGPQPLRTLIGIP